MTTKELANDIGVTKGYISQIENNRTSPSLDSLEKILERLGTNFQDFFGTSEQIKEESLVEVFSTAKLAEAEVVDEELLFTKFPLLPTNSSFKVEIVEIQPNGQTEIQKAQVGETFGYVLDGRVEIFQNEEVTLVERFETFYFPNIKENYVTNLDKLDKILALSSSQIDEIVTVYNYSKENIINIGAGYNEKVFFPLNNYEPKEKLEILYAGKFDESKGFYELIKAFRILETKVKNVELDLIGNLKEEDKERVYSLVGDSKNIKIYNAMDQAHLGEIMCQKDIFILPSYFEGLGLIAVEALGSGLRVVATEIEGLIEFLGDKINKSEIIEYIAMPTIYDTDKAVEEEKPAFIERIITALELMIERTRKERKIPQELLEEVERHSWKKKIETIYNLL